MSETKNKLDLEITRVVAAPPQLIWQAWTNPMHLAKWWAPAPLTTKVLTFDPRPGGAFDTIMTAPDGKEYPAKGVFLELVEHERIVFTDALEAGWRPGRAPFMTAIIAIAPREKGARYVVRVLHKSEADRKKHEEMGFFEGWGACIGQLELVAQSLAGEIS